MTRIDHLERALPAILEDVGRGPAPDYADAILTGTAPIAQRPVWTFPGRWLPSSAAGGWSGGVWRLPSRTIAAVGLITVVLAAGAVAYVGGRPARLPAPPRLPAAAGPAANGLIAYDHDGDIYVGDPSTGRTTAIVTGPTNDSGPIFAPDGTHIAFLRGQDAKDVVVVRPDGSAEQVITPKAIRPVADFIVAIAWTPDSGRIVVAQGGTGQLEILDAAGVASPRRLTPPLRAWPQSAGLFDAVAGVASNFRPPLGDQVVATGDIDALRVLEADLQSATQLARTALEPYEHYAVASAGWSPDGSRILFSLRRVSSAGDLWSGDLGTFVVDADGSDLSHVGDGGGGASWSPDGSKIAYQRPSDPGGVVTIVHLASGAERQLRATDPTTGQSLADLRGWSWSPDGRSILFLEQGIWYESRPLVVDIENGVTTQLPWAMSSPPSWQRVPID